MRSLLSSQKHLVQTWIGAGHLLVSNSSLAFHCSLDKEQQGTAVPFCKDTGDLTKDDNRPASRILVLYSLSQRGTKLCDTSETKPVPTGGTSLPVIHSGAHMEAPHREEMPPVFQRTVAFPWGPPGPPQRSVSSRLPVHQAQATGCLWGEWEV